TRVASGQVVIDVAKNLSRGSGRTRVRMGDAVSNSHEYGRRRSVSADVGDQNAPLSFRQREEIVVVAARPPRGLVEGGQVQRRDIRQLSGQERPLDVRDHL